MVLTHIDRQNIANGTNLLNEIETGRPCLDATSKIAALDGNEGTEEQFRKTVWPNSRVWKGARAENVLLMLSPFHPHTKYGIAINATPTKTNT